ncbi:MAG: threonylcarbamoyl-AMP synthase [Deltaproteobacteria bacterium CG17_big_fil_post_rev_8_21_14_2_50_63_7]|nr:MAG: threonylcarbamoyl-AMP synthase [Deltaproteobacteria bacterium CG17_big_fil_post_rev_8_21_14_2_50_63_7]
MKITIDPDRPNPRVLRQVVDILKAGGVIAYPTDTIYGLGCDIFQKRAVERVYQIKGKDRRKSLSFICSSLKDISRYAEVSDHSYRLMKRIFPGPYTVILQASKLVPRVMLNNNARTVGIRIPDHSIPIQLVEMLGNPIITTSIPTLPDLHYNDPNEIERRLEGRIEVLIDSGLLHPEPSTILDLTEDIPRLLRRGKGEIDHLGVIEIDDDISEF